MWQYYAAVSVACFATAFILAFLGNIFNELFRVHQKYNDHPVYLKINIGVRKWE